MNLCASYIQSLESPTWLLSKELKCMALTQTCSYSNVKVVLCVAKFAILI